MHEAQRIELMLRLDLARDVQRFKWGRAPDFLRLPDGKILNGFNRSNFDQWKEAWQAEAEKIEAKLAEPQKTDPDDILQEVSKALAGEDGCCCLWNEDGRCCMTDRAVAVFHVIERRTGLSLEDLEAREKAKRHDTV